jgi:hypothetical protein
MAADVVEGRDTISIGSDDNKVFSSYFGQKERSRIRNFLFSAHANPTLSEDFLPLKIEYRLIEIELPRQTLRLRLETIGGVPKR